VSRKGGDQLVNAEKSRGRIRDGNDRKTWNWALAVEELTSDAYFRKEIKSKKAGALDAEIDSPFCGLDAANEGHWRNSDRLEL